MFCLAHAPCPLFGSYLAAHAFAHNTAVTILSTDDIDSGHDSVHSIGFASGIGHPGF